MSDFYNIPQVFLENALTKNMPTLSECAHSDMRPVESEG